MDETGDYYTERSKSEEKNTNTVYSHTHTHTHTHTHIYIYVIQKDGNGDPICETGKETQIQRTDFWTLWEKARVG